SNESTFGVIESSTRTITHMKDIFSLNSPPSSQKVTATLNNSGDTITFSSLSNSTAASTLCDEVHRQNLNETATNNSEQQP
ncbi:unnamed protein product, partial [Rotaria magnacalcarata]